MPFKDVPDVVRKRMSRIRKTGSKPEVLVRRTAHRLGYRFRINQIDLPGTPDIVFPRLRKIIFVHGCFWHQHPGCRHSTTPQIRQDYWLPKLSRTVARDRATSEALEALGWRVTTIWECETRDESRLESIVKDFLLCGH
jgi:DNA mismatch endonuclease Vsr